MSASTLTRRRATTDLTALTPGDRVAVMRGSRKVAETTVIDRREIPAVPAVCGFAGRKQTVLVRVGGGRWYDLFTGLQREGDGTRLRVAAQR